jgi:DNA-binding response OmpR family regulator
MVLDWMMPVLSGFEVIKTLQAEKHGDIPVIVITAQVTDENTIETIRKEINVADFVAKPIQAGLFTARVHEILNTK